MSSDLIVCHLKVCLNFRICIKNWNLQKKSYFNNLQIKINCFKIDWSFFLNKKKNI